jgi:hypothetical protein
MHTRYGRRVLETPWAWGLSFLGAAVLALLGAAVGGGDHPVVMLALFAALAAVIAAAAPLLSAPLAAGTCWCFYDGFFVRRHGQLGIRQVTDLIPLALLAAAPFLAWAVGHTLRRGARVPVGTVDDNLLARPTDRARARLRRRRTRLLAFAAAVGIIAGADAYVHEAAASVSVKASAEEVVATTAAAAVPPARRGGPRGGGAVLVVRVPVRWQDPAGVWHEDTMPVARGRAAGTKLSVWVDRSGNLTDAPAGAADLVLLSALVGLATTGGGAVLVLVGTAVARRRLDRRDWRAWEHDWARVEPDWSGRRRNHGVGGS